MTEYGFCQSKANYSLFVKKILEKDHLVLLIYVDDIFIGSTSQSTLQDFKAFLGEKFNLKDLEEPKYFLGLEIA